MATNLPIYETGSRRSLTAVIGRRMARHEVIESERGSRLSSLDSNTSEHLPEREVVDGFEPAGEEERQL